MPRTFPFVPKSSRGLAPGDYWAIPLDDSAFACGRVIALMPSGMPGAMRGFLGGLMDWTGRALPTAESIAGHSTTDQGVMHILAITTSGGAVLGNRPLELDGIEPFLFLHGMEVRRGFQPVRSATSGDRKSLPTFSWWGYDIILTKANQRFRVPPPPSGR